MAAGTAPKRGAGRSPRPFPRPAIEPRTSVPTRLDGGSGHWPETPLDAVPRTDDDPERVTRGIILVTLAGATVIVMAGCGVTATTDTVTRTETVTVTRTETVAKVVSPPLMVFVPQPGGLEYKPDSLAAGVHAGPYNIRWKSYGGPTAIGTGIFPSNDCDPSCAEGTITRINITVRLTRRIACRGLLAYSMMAIEGRGFDGEPGLIQEVDEVCRRG
jgi:hypothetical protein